MKNSIKIVFGLLLMTSIFACKDEAISSPALTNEVKLALNEAIQDEYKAMLFYQKTIDKFGQVTPYVNIVDAEVKHQQSLAKLFQNYGLEVPMSQWKDSEITTFSSVQASCANCYQAEIDNIALYDKYLSLDLPDDVRKVFENNRAASLNKHLPAFTNCK
ncbi:MAG: ferritin-like domain-containing protein [Emticicia sp.]|jgi:hypothetical protein|uniref:ferritin-like domain-containing protein n=1 Tax=Emticicia sp. TaxID=1930953 RepID=UPI003BA47194